VHHHGHRVAAVDASHDGSGAGRVHGLGRQLLGRAAAAAAAAGGGQVDGEDLAEEPGRSIPIETEIVIHAHPSPPVGPKRSVLMAAGP
jgi:hypothetical protein